MRVLSTHTLLHFPFVFVCARTHFLSYTWFAGKVSITVRLFCVFESIKLGIIMTNTKSIMHQIFYIPLEMFLAYCKTLRQNMLNKKYISHQESITCFISDKFYFIHHMVRRGRGEIRVERSILKRN